MPSLMIRKVWDICGGVIEERFVRRTQDAPCSACRSAFDPGEEAHRLRYPSGGGGVIRGYSRACDACAADKIERLYQQRQRLLRASESEAPS